MLLYVTDNGASNAFQFADIKWTQFDGTNWSVPATIHTNTQAEFSPQVAYDGNGDAIAVWERVADANFNETNLTAMVAQMEIVWSRWSRTNGAWATPVALTANGYLDHAPQLCGPMANGDVLLTWTKNEANLLMGTGPAGSVSNSVVMQSRWSAASQTWAAPQVLVASPCSGHGFKFSSAIGEALADLIVTGEARFDLSLFRRRWPASSGAGGV